MDENISRAAGATHGQLVTPEELRALATSAGRTAVQRTTLYGTAPAAPPPADARGRMALADRLQGQSAEQFGPRELVELGVRAERVGLDSVMVSDHFQPWRHVGGHAPFSLAWLAAIGERTERVVLGTSVLTPTFRYNPAVLAQAFATLALLYPGRVVLGVGTGEALNEIAVGLGGVAGLQGALRPAARGRPADARAVGRRAGHLRGRVLPHRRRHDLRPPEGGVPIYVAAGGPVVAKYAGRVGRRLHLHQRQGHGPLHRQAAARRRRRPAAARRDRRHRPDDRDQAVLRAHPRGGAREHPLLGAAVAQREEKHRLDDPVEMAYAADELPIEEVAQRWIVETTPRGVVDAVRPYVEAGFDHLVFHAPGHDQEAFLTSFGRDVLPLCVGSDRSGGAPDPTAGEAVPAEPSKQTSPRPSRGAKRPVGCQIKPIQAPRVGCP